MRPFLIEFRSSVNKDLKKIDRAYVHRIFAKLQQLENYPNVPGIEKLSLKEPFYRIRVGDYRIVFKILGAEHKIVIHFIRHRREVYRGF